MKTLIFSSIALVGLLLVGLQHQQLRELRAENAGLQKASAEASQLKADLEKSNGDEAQDADEIARLREENHDLLKLRGEINQLRDAKGQFEKVSAENQRLQLLAKTAVKTDSNQAMQPITVQINNLVNRGLNTPEDAVQTFYWAQRDRNADTLERSVTPCRKMEAISAIITDDWRRQGISTAMISIDIVARRDVDATTVQMGVQLHSASSPQNWCGRSS